MRVTVTKRRTIRVLTLASLAAMAVALPACGGNGAPCFAPTDPVPEQGRLAGMTAEHNVIRANATPAPNPPLSPLTWDPDVAAVAQGWANCLASRGCPLEHNPGRGNLGENIYWGYGAPTTAADVVDAWASEASCYDYATNSCDTTACPYSCGHYTQLVWRATQRVGCGVADCPGANGGTVWVCDYAPPGNFIGQTPY